MRQSFDRKDKITPEEAHRIGEELAKKLTDEKYEYVVATHIDKGHIHNHIIPVGRTFKKELENHLLY